MDPKLDRQHARSVPSKWATNGSVDCSSNGFSLSSKDGRAEITFDYERAEGGMPYLEISKVSSTGGPVEVDIIFSETFAGLQSGTGRST